MAPNRPLIGLTGFMEAGKGEVAKVLRQAGFLTIKLAGPLKAAFRAMLRAAGVTDDVIERMVEGDLKEKPADVLGGRTPRYAMQTLGTEWGRDLIAPDLWIAMYRERVETLPATKIVTDDVRFLNEAKLIRDMGGAIWRVERESASAGDHPSELEQLMIQPNVTIRNNGTLSDLHRAVREQIGG